MNPQNFASRMSPMRRRNHGERICSFTALSGFPLRLNSMTEESTAFFRFSMTLVRCVSMRMSSYRSYNLNLLE